MIEPELLANIETRYDPKRFLVQLVDRRSGEVVAAVTSEMLAFGGKKATDLVTEQLERVK